MLYIDILPLLDPLQALEGPFPASGGNYTAHRMQGPCKASGELFPRRMHYTAGRWSKCAHMVIFCSFVAQIGPFSERSFHIRGLPYPLAMVNPCPHPGPFISWATCRAAPIGSTAFFVPSSGPIPVYISRPFFPSRHTRPAPLHCMAVAGFSCLPPVAYPLKACKPLLGPPMTS